MGRIIVQEKSAAAVEQLLNSVNRTGLPKLEGVLACSFTFDSGYFGRFLDAVAGCHPEGDELLRSIPIDVVCDSHHYRNHEEGYNVQCWRGGNLFHPKLLLLLFSDRIVWIEGSLNLTRAGYEVNQELATYHESLSRRLPHGVRELVRTLANEGVATARRVLDACGADLRTDSWNRSVTSLDGTLLTNLLGRVAKARRVFIVSPFFDRRDGAEPSIETTVLRTLAAKYPSAHFRIFLPEITRVDGTRALQGSRTTFARAFGPTVRRARLDFCGVPSDRRPLHAKFLAIQHGNRGAHATVLTGSPNLTEQALLKRGAKANVELAREFKLRWRDVEQLLFPLGRKFRKLSDCDFDPPKQIEAPGWIALKSATYYPYRQELILEWRGASTAKQTHLYYAGELLAVPKNGQLQGFLIRGGELRLESVNRSNPQRRSWCPIIIPFGEQLALAELPEETSPPPEWWLAQLGALPKTLRSGDYTRKRKGEERAQAYQKFDLGNQVRDLAERMKYAEDILADESSGSKRANAHTDLLQKIFESHDPVTATSPVEQVWRMWVRIEVTQIFASLRGRRGKAMATQLARELRNTKVPKAMLRQWRNLTTAQ